MKRRGEKQYLQDAAHVCEHVPVPSDINPYLAYYLLLLIQAYALVNAVVMQKQNQKILSNTAVFTTSIIAGFLQSLELHRSSLAFGWESNACFCFWRF
jgi:hypothetical protein